MLLARQCRYRGKYLRQAVVENNCPAPSLSSEEIAATACMWIRGHSPPSPLHVIRQPLALVRFHVGISFSESLELIPGPQKRTDIISSIAGVTIRA